MYAILEAAPSKHSPTKTSIEYDRFPTRRAAENALCALYLAGRYDRYVERLIEAPVWIERVYDVLDGSGEIGTFRTARDGRSFVQVGRVCVWGRRGESEESLRARKAYQIENA